MSEELEDPVENERKIRIKLEANDGIVIEVDIDVALQCHLIKQMLEHLGIPDPEEADLQDILPIGNVNGTTLQKLMEWCTEHRGEVFVPRNEDEDERTVLSEKDKEWLNVPNNELIDLLMGASFLDIPGIIDIITQKIANMARGKTASQLRELFCLPNDVPPAIRPLGYGSSWI